MEAFKGIREYCHPEDAELLQKLNVQDSEETEKKLEEEEKKGHQSNPNRKLVHNLKSGFGKKVKHSLAATSVAIGLAFSAVPALLLLPICLVPVAISTIIGVAGYFFWDAKAKQKDEPLGELCMAVISIVFPIAVAGVCFSPALLFGSPMYLAGAAIEIVPKLIPKRNKSKREF